MKTTLNAIRTHSPCEDGWKKLLSTLGKTKADDEPVSILQILNSNGLDDALWCFRAVDGYEKDMRRLALWCARSAEKYSDDERVKTCNDVNERHINGEATDEELAAARDAAWAAARDAAWAAARDAARDAAWAAAWDAAWAAARDAAWAAARDAAWAAARDAAWAAAWDAAWAAARDAQEKELRRLLAEIEKRDTQK